MIDYVIWQIGKSTVQTTLDPSKKIKANYDAWPIVENSTT